MCTGVKLEVKKDGQGLEGLPVLSMQALFFLRLWAWRLYVGR